MYSVVHSEDCLLAEGLPAVTADVGLLPSVHPLVGMEVPGLTKSLLACIAFEWLLASFDSLMSL